MKLKGCDFFLLLIRGTKKRLTGTKISMGCVYIRRKFKGYEKFSPFSEKNSNRVSGLTKDRPLKFGGTIGLRVNWTPPPKIDRVKKLFLLFYQNHTPSTFLIKFLITGAGLRSPRISSKISNLLKCGSSPGEK